MLQYPSVGIELNDVIKVKVKDSQNLSKILDLLGHPFIKAVYAVSNMNILLHFTLSFCSQIKKLKNVNPRFVTPDTNLKRSDLRSQKCRCAWFSHKSLQFAMVKQMASLPCGKIFHMQLFHVHHSMSLAQTFGVRMYDPYG